MAGDGVGVNVGRSCDGVEPVGDEGVELELDDIANFSFVRTS